MKKSLLIAILISGLTLTALPANALETRCGWLNNPTPANFFLQDRDATWTIARQGGYQANGIENLPPHNEKEYVKTNGSYGYSCVCLDVLTDNNEMRIISVQGGESLPLSTCSEDPNLQKR